MLAIACGTGQIAISAARAGVHVTRIDIATNSIEQTCDRAQTEGLAVQFDQGDAEQIPYRDASDSIRNGKTPRSNDLSLLTRRSGRVLLR